MRSAFLAVLILIARSAAAVSVPLDLSGVRPGPISVARAEESVTITWPDETGRVWGATFSLNPAQPLVTSIGAGADPVDVIIRSARPFYKDRLDFRTGFWRPTTSAMPATLVPGGRRCRQIFHRRASAIAHSI
jgi:hypothetical protein